MMPQRGPVSAAAMRAQAVPALDPFRSQHCTEEEYGASLRAVGRKQAFVYLRLSERRRFVQLWPNLEDWLRAPLNQRMGRLHGQTRRTLSCPATYHARPYLYYLALRGHLRLDLPWLFAVGDLTATMVAQPLGIDFGCAVLADEAVQLGLSRASTQLGFRWLLPRIALHRGLRPVLELGDDDVARFLAGVREFAHRPDLADFWGPAERFRELSKSWVTSIGQLQAVLYHRGQAATAPRKARPNGVTPAPQATMQALVDRWMERRLGYNRPASVYNDGLAIRGFLNYLAEASPRVRSFADVRRGHVLGWLQAMAAETMPRTGLPLVPHTRSGRVGVLGQFFRDASDWGWPGILLWPLVHKRELPGAITRVPRYIPTAELARIMEAVRALPCPFQRAAILVARWSGARRGEIIRLPTDCLDSYPDGTARLRIPVGKTSRERVVPLHDEAADALRAVLAVRATGKERALPDERTGDPVRFVFVRFGKLMGARHLFETPLQRCCQVAGLVDADGRGTITAHRFRHTMGTQLAERGARLQTIMSVLGHESAAMAMVYARVSDPEVLRDYRSVLEPGAVIAGAGAEAVRSGALDRTAVHWLKTNFLKTELELGHCLRLPSEGPCECDLYLNCSRFVTTPAYVPRLRERHQLELTLAEDARARSWNREVERHCAVAGRIERLLADLGKATP